MIVALILCDRTAPVADGQAAYFLPLGEESVIERIAGTVLRGPFGGAIVMAAPVHAVALQEQLQGFAVQHLEARSAGAGPHAALAEALAAAEKFRARWEKAMAAAAARFGGADDVGDEGAPSRRGNAPVKDGGKKAPWTRHRKSADVKIRGLARSFERDGVIVFRGERPGIGLELQAHLVDAFGREGEARGDAARPFARPVCAGQHGYPLVLSVVGAREVGALPPSTDLEAWLAQRPECMQEIPVDDSGAIESLDDARAYSSIRQRLERD